MPSAALAGAPRARPRRCAVLPQELGRTDDVGEQEGDGAGGKAGAPLHGLDLPARREPRIAVALGPRNGGLHDLVVVTRELPAGHRSVTPRRDPTGWRCDRAQASAPGKDCFSEATSCW